MKKIYQEFHIARSFTPTLFVQSASGWIAPPDAEIQFEEPTRLVILFVSPCKECCMAANSWAYVLGMN